MFVQLGTAVGIEVESGPRLMRWNSCRLRVAPKANWSAVLTLMALYVLGAPVLAQGTGAVRSVAAVLNPLTNEAQVLITPTVAFLDTSPSQTQSSLNFQPRVPFAFANDWRLVTRSNVAIIRTPAGEQSMSLSDVDMQFFVAPATQAAWTWGVGPIVELPTATQATAGTGKWSAGPTGALLYIEGPWANGVVVSHVRSFAGPGRREDVNLTAIEAQMSYTFDNHWYVASDPIFEYDWRASSGQKWIVPVGVEGGRAFTVNSQELSVQVGAYYNVQKPHGKAGWTLSAEFGWVH